MQLVSQQVTCPSYVGMFNGDMKSKKYQSFLIVVVIFQKLFMKLILVSLFNSGGWVLRILKIFIEVNKNIK